MSESDGTENYQNWHPGLQYLNGQQQHLQQQFHHPSTAPHVVSLATNFIDVPNNQQQPHQQIQHQQQCESQNNFSNYELFGGSGGMGVETTCNNILTNLVSNIIPQPQYQQQQHVPSPPMMGAPAPGYLPQQQTPTRVPHTTHQAFQSIRPLIATTNATNGSFQDQDHSPVPEVKKRIVAEVKPMRMSYSDVLSKSKSNGQKESEEDAPSSPRNFVQNNNLKNNTAEKSEKAEKKTPQVERKQSSPPILSPMSSVKPEENSTAMKKKPVSVLSATVNPKKKLATSKSNPTITMQQQPQSQQPQQQTKPMKSEQVSKKKSKKVESETKTQSRNSSKQGSVSSTSDDKEGYYNVTKTEKPTSHSKEGNVASSRKSRHNGISVNKKSNKRSKNKENHQSNQNNSNTMELLNALLSQIFENFLKLLSWLFYLIYDIVVIGFSMAYEQSLFYYSIYVVRLKSWIKDIHQNSDKPNIWIKAKWKKFDARFPKTSKWAFWRNFYKKKPIEASSEFYKNGRLPSTAEEAMYSLLNCKGKDAYSILGVQADCSQEQIRKHYKKIAVLVHPDKNKQAGAEEAFKVLRRAFELVGEPESRKTYDRSLLEALNAEKAWSELHDLLSQLQTKISEAANTIRCSSCSSRHPRKLTDRAQYAARECNSCKIRHPAKEGDIWAETSCFGLRWKYLALMESKVYDITEWANCQKGALSHLQPNSHVVQYRIVRGGQQQQNQQSANKFNRERQRFRGDRPMGEPTLHDFLDNLYSGQNPHGNFQKPASTTSKRRNRKN